MADEVKSSSSDPQGDEAFYYTLVVPADAHRLFPCFDQPDLKASFALSLEVPQGWTAVANGELEGSPALLGNELLRFTFQKSAPISTYLFAFAAGVSFLLSVSLWFVGLRDEGIFVGLWVPSILSLGAFLLAGKGGR